MNKDLKYLKQLFFMASRRKVKQFKDSYAYLIGRQIGVIRTKKKLK